MAFHLVKYGSTVAGLANGCSGTHFQIKLVCQWTTAELVVEVTAAISTYLGKKLRGTSEEIEPDEFPFKN